MDEFFVGYLPVPPATRKFVRHVVAGLFALLSIVAVIMVLSQTPFAASRFEFQEFREYEGSLTSVPYPALSNGWLLVAPGKHGASGLPSGYVKLKGQRIQNGDLRMLELLPGSVVTAPGVVSPVEQVSLGQVEWTGEIVDSKCYYGVMNPGRGKVHRDCAARCIAGGIPPALLVRDATGTARAILLSNPALHPLGKELLDHVAEPVVVHGQLERINGQLILRTTRIQGR